MLSVSSVVISLLGLGCCFSVGNRDGHQCIGSVLALEEVCTTEDTEKKCKGRPFVGWIDLESGCRIVVGRTVEISSPLLSFRCALGVLGGDFITWPGLLLLGWKP